MEKLLLICVVLLLGACETLHYGSNATSKLVDFPPIGEVTTANVGDALVSKGTQTTEDAISIKTNIDEFFHYIPVGTYTKVASSDKYDYYSALSVTHKKMAPKVEHIAIPKNDDTLVCVTAEIGKKRCYIGRFERTKKISAQADSFQQTLLYSGKIGNKINISYREFNNDFARPAFSNNVEYDLSESNQIGYKGALIEVIEATNTSITYKLLKNFK